MNNYVAYSNQANKSRPISGALFFVGYSVFSVISFIFAPSVSAKTELSLSPTTAYVLIEPGTTSSHSISLRNTGAETVVITPTLVDFLADGTTGQPQLTRTSTFPYLDEVTVPSKSAADETAKPEDKSSGDGAVSLENALGGMQLTEPFTILPGETQKITLLFDVPKDAPFQEYHLTALFQAAAEGKALGQTAVQPSLGANIIVGVHGKEATPIEPLQVKNLGLPRLVDSLRPVELKPLVVNTAPIAQVASGAAVLKNWRGVTVATFEIYPDVILAQSSRVIRAAAPANSALPSVPPNSPDFTNSPDSPTITPVQFIYDPLFLIGPHSFELTFISPPTALNPQGTTITRSHRFFALPYSILVIAVFAYATYAWISRRQKIKNSSI